MRSIYPFVRQVLLTTLVCLAIVQSHEIKAQFRDTAASAVVAHTESKKHVRDDRDDRTIWLMVGLALDVTAPNVGNDLNVLGYSYKFGLTDGDRILQFAFHGIGQTYQQGKPWEEHRNDYAVLYGFCYRGREMLLTAAGGLGVVSYRRRGAPTGIDGLDSTYQELVGDEPGLRVGVDIYYTPFFKEWGVFGIGVYGSLSKSQSFFAIGFSLIELNLALN